MTRPGLPEALLDPAAWPHPVAGPTLVETHISWVFLTGGLAYKVKKPVRFDFLDFSSRERRSHYCAEELRLNARFAPSLYLGLSRIVRVGERLAVDQDGELVEHAVRMRQFDRREELDALVEAGRVEPRELDRLGARVAAQQAAAPRPPPGFDEGGVLAAACADNFATLTRLAAAPAAELAAGAAWLQAALRRLAPLLADRLATGRVRECHGDLHCANVVRHAGELWPFDALEFDPALRWIDTACDFAFLWMDLHARGRADLATAALDGWLQASGDFEALRALRAFAAYRAGVRAKVAGLRRAQAPDQGNGRELARYLAAATRLSRPGPPRLVVTTGLSASGKSRLAAALLAPLGAVRVRSDVERKRLAGLAAEEPSGGRIYDAAMTRRTYARLAEAAGCALDGGFSVIVDAASLLRRERDVLREVAARRGLPCRLLEVVAPLDTLRSRLDARAAAGGDPSEATRAVLARQVGFAEPLAADEQAGALRVDTSGPVDPAALAVALGA